MSARNGSVLITGGAGFIGANLADRLLSDGRRVTVFDNLSRPGVDLNLHWLRQRHGARLEVELGDVRDRTRVRNAVARAGTVFHFAAQVAVTSSLVDVFHDFDVNAGGTLNVLDAARLATHRPLVVFTSTNKVYGGLDDVRLVASPTRWEPEDERLRQAGIDESRPLDFHSPYGCSKGTADQYVRDFARSFGVPTVVFRMSCIYGPRQFGNEDQGWVAHFARALRAGTPLTIYGDGRQVRDVLCVDDLVEAFLRAEASGDRVAGKVFNIGGGPSRATSLLELIELLGTLCDARADIAFAPWRVGDQRYYVSDIRLAQRELQWQPAVSLQEGLRRLDGWMRELEAAGLAKTRFRKVS